MTTEHAKPGRIEHESNNAFTRSKRRVEEAGKTLDFAITLLSTPEKPLSQSPAKQLVELARAELTQREREFDFNTKLLSDTNMLTWLDAAPHRLNVVYARTLDRVTVREAIYAIMESESEPPKPPTARQDIMEQALISAGRYAKEHSERGLLARALLQVAEPTARPSAALINDLANSISPEQAARVVGDLTVEQRETLSRQATQLYSKPEWKLKWIGSQMEEMAKRRMITTRMQFIALFNSVPRASEFEELCLSRPPRSPEELILRNSGDVPTYWQWLTDQWLRSDLPEEGPSGTDGSYAEGMPTGAQGVAGAQGTDGAQGATGSTADQHGVTHDIKRRIGGEAGGPTGSAGAQDETPTFLFIMCAHTDCHKLVAASKADMAEGAQGWFQVESHKIILNRTTRSDMGGSRFAMPGGVEVEISYTCPGAGALVRARKP